jgi:hypothetical protein
MSGDPRHPRYVSVAVAAWMLGVTAGKVRKLVDGGLLAAVDTSGAGSRRRRLRISVISLERFIAARTVRVGGLRPAKEI